MTETFGDFKCFLNKENDKGMKTESIKARKNYFRILSWLAA